MRRRALRIKVTRTAKELLRLLRELCISYEDCDKCPFSEGSSCVVYELMDMLHYYLRTHTRAKNIPPHPSEE